MSPTEKKKRIEASMSDIMVTLGLDLSDDSLRETPRRVAKMYVDEIFYGLDEGAFPAITAVQNSFGYDQMLVECNITINSLCEHHFVPIVGYAHIAYVPKGWVLGLSKFNRVADYYARRPQVQERLTQQILNKLVEVLDTPDVAVVIDASHMCVRLRGIKDQGTVTRTAALSGCFREALPRDEFFRAIPRIAQGRV